MNFYFSQVHSTAQNTSRVTGRNIIKTVALEIIKHIDCGSL